MQNTCRIPCPCGFFVAADDVARLARFLVRPVIASLIVVALSLSLLVAIREVAPYVTNASIIPHQIATKHIERGDREQDLQRQVDAYLETLRNAAPDAPISSMP